jgi:VWFA-related protein
MSRALAAGLVLASAAALLAQEAPPRDTLPTQAPRFPATVEQVIVDVVVTDASGRPVTGLGIGDFVLGEDGVRQTLVSFEPFVARDVKEPDATQVPPRVAVNAPAQAAASGRVFALVFDDVRMTQAQGIAARKAVEDFLRTGVRPGDHVLLAATGGGVFWGTRMNEGREDLLARLARLQGREVVDVSADSVTDSEAARIEVQRDAGTFWRVVRRFKRSTPPLGLRPAGSSPGVPQVTEGFLNGTETQNCTMDPEPCIVANAVKLAYQRALARLRDSLGFLERVLAALEGSRGRKSVIFVSPGFYQDSEVTNLFRNVAEASRRANAPVSFLNTAGLGDFPVDLSAQVGGVPAPVDIGESFAEVSRAAAGTEVVVNDTGGTIVRRNDLTSGLRRIVDESGSYYLLGYTSTNQAADGRFRKIEVKLSPATDRKGFEVRARRGYYAPGGAAAARRPDAEAVLRDALDSPLDRAGLPLRLTAHFLEEGLGGKLRCLLVGEVDVRALGFREEDGRSLASLDLVFATMGPEDAGWNAHGRKAEMRLLPATRDRLLRDWYVVSDEVALHRGASLAKLVVRDPASGRIGSVSQRLVVPDPDAFRISTPIVTDLAEAGSKGEPTHPRAIARRDFAVGGRLFVSFEIYGASRAEGERKPKVSARFEVLRPDGQVLASLPARQVEAAADGSLRRLFGISLEKAEPGEHQVVVEVTDEVSGRTVLWTEAFKVVPVS